MLRFFFRNKPDPAVRQLYEAAVAQARSPVFYTHYSVADTLDGRFEMIVLHMTALINGLTDGDVMGLDGQALFDHFLSDMDQIPELELNNWAQSADIMPDPEGLKT